MSVYRRLELRTPERVRERLASQLQIDGAQLAAIPTDGIIRLHEQLNYDDLTGVLSRRAGMAALEEMVQEVRRSGNRELVVVFVDVDGLKDINDVRGHAVGDLALEALADVFEATLRREDVVFRYGGDEFVCVLPFTTLDVASELMLEGWRALRGLGWCGFSAGFAELRCDDTASTLVARADECLYAGRRRSQRRDWRIAQ